MSRRLAIGSFHYVFPRNVATASAISDPLRGFDNTWTGNSMSDPASPSVRSTILVPSFESIKPACMSAGGKQPSSTTQSAFRAAPAAVAQSLNGSTACPCALRAKVIDRRSAGSLTITTIAEAVDNWTPEAKQGGLPCFWVAHISDPQLVLDQARTQVFLLIRLWADRQ